MNYLEEYNDIIEQAKQRDSYSKRWNIGTHDHGYVETHHIVPRCLGGTDDISNLVVLTPQEHYNAHRLLALANPNSDKLQYAYWMMCNDTLQARNYSVSCEEYAIAKIKHSSMVRERMSGSTHPLYGKRVSKNVSLAVSQANRNRKGEKRNVPVSDETKRKQSIAKSKPRPNLVKYKIGLDDMPIMTYAELNLYVKKNLGIGIERAYTQSTKITVYGELTDGLVKKLRTNISKVTIAEVCYGTQ